MIIIEYLYDFLFRFFFRFRNGWKIEIERLNFKYWKFDAF